VTDGGAEVTKLKPFFSPKIWGYEKWTVSSHPHGRSLPPDYDYPLLVKIIRAEDTLSVQVHPDDDYARIHEHSRGKTECWYVLDAKRGASLVCGLSGSYSAGELREAIRENRLDPYLNSVPVKKGDLVFIPAGLVHAIQGGIRLLEVQESSDITYRLYDWGRGREVHIEQGLEVFKNLRPQVIREFSGRFECPYFTLDTVEGEAELASEADFAFFVFGGRGELRGVETGPAVRTTVAVKVRRNDTVFCRKAEKLFVSAGIRGMKITPRDV
jgi:mannose-6-phosphate isomerase